jgi:hypothetical protein
MNIPIRMIDLATAISWILLITLSVSAVYSVKDLALNLGKPQMETTSDGKILFSLPIEITNKGYYNIDLFNITTKVLDNNGSTITQGSTLIPTIEKGESLAILHNMTFDISRLLQLSQTYLFNDTELNTLEFISMKLGQLIPVQVSGNLSIPWGAPLYNFKLGEPRYAQLNLTHMQVTVPISFDNHALIDIAGEVQTSMYNVTDQLVGQGQVEIKVAQQSHYEGSVMFCVAVQSATRTGWFELNFHTRLFSYGPMVIPYG